jgi:hypothetical protein
MLAGTPIYCEEDVRAVKKKKRKASKERHREESWGEEQDVFIRLLGGDRCLTVLV